MLGAVTLGSGVRGQALDRGVPLRILPLGASITWGQGSSDGNGYRGVLRTRLTAAGIPADMVGSRQHGTMRDNDVEGWPGFRIEQVHEVGEVAASAFLPNVVLVHAGTNDAVQNMNVSSAGDRMKALLNSVYVSSPNTVIILGTLVVNRNSRVNELGLEISRQFVSLAKELSAEGRRLVVVDMQSDLGPTWDDMDDDTHPNDAGYQKMAGIWHAGLLQASDQGWLQVPDPAAGNDKPEDRQEPKSNSAAMSSAAFHGDRMLLSAVVWLLLAR
ncbi:SGNH hydrolase-type esterase domain-containing protein [Podospora didyma]|uniref:SGNH hydrolase-type esterase domain-containing protein n=1 Tax=Podospora didyma TaxID=330526 RepID=A0AAE0JYK6_9PEZI|nr:SGNH hydrolase-type esterase domain-containing protein [Podospora didyma]